MLYWIVHVCLIISVTCVDFLESFDGNYYDNNDFTIAFEWSYINFTWRSNRQYSKAILGRKYVPENVMPGGIKIYRDTLYIALPRFRTGVPVTLSSLSIQMASKSGSLLRPFPSWKDNDDSTCENLQSMLSMEIDSNGIMYVIDGVRINNNNVQCPCKIVLLDINNYGRRIQTLILSNELCLQDGGFLNDIVVDETDGDFAYIADTSSIDPGIVVFSRYQNRGWKVRDQAMFSQRPTNNFVIAGDTFSQLTPVDGIALSPKSPRKTLYFCSLMAYDIFAIRSDVLKNEQLSRSYNWRYHVQKIGRKQSQTDGMMMDSKGNLYYSLIPLYGAGRWNIYDSFDNSEIIYEDRKTFIWTDGFAMDQKGNLYLMTNWAYRYFEVNYTLQFSPDIKFRIHRLHTGTRSYLYNDLEEFEKE